MAEGQASRLWAMRGAYAGLALVLVLFQLLPLETTPRRWAPPDVLLLLTLCWAARRPDYVPVLSVAAVMLLTDLLFQRPPGLWAALAVVGTEYLRRASRGLRDASFAFEWFTVALVIAAMTFGNRMVMALTMTSQIPLLLNMIQMTMSILFYPVVAAASHLLFGVRKTQPGEVNALGQRI
jgi:rod shape-determining protein MreD